MRNKIKVGFVDSGIGGLFFAADLVQSIFNSRNLFISNFFVENVEFMHFGDTKNMPFGMKNAEELREITQNLINIACNNGCKIIFIACNTADTSLDSKMIEYFDQKQVKLIRIVKESAKQIVKKTLAINDIRNILVLATKRTIESKIYENEIMQYAKSSNCKVNIINYSPEHIESSIENGISISEVKQIIEKFYLNNKKTVENLNSIGLFCTHFAFFRVALKDFLRQINLKHVKVFVQGSFFKEKIVSLFKKDIQDFRQKNDVNNLKFLRRSEIRIKSFFTSERDFIKYKNMMQNFNKNLNIDFKII